MDHFDRHFNRQFNRRGEQLFLPLRATPLSECHNSDSSDSRIDRSLIVDMSEEVLDEFMCGICHEIFVDPMVTPCCRQTYCNECISRWLQSHSTCPNDRKMLSRSQMSPPARAMINLFNSMKIKCKYHTNGCQHILKVSEMTTHLNECAHNICEECGSGRRTDVKHNCISNLKIKIKSLTAENKRLTNENKELFEDFKRISDENRELKLKKSDVSSIPSFPSTSSQYMTSGDQKMTFEDKLHGIMKQFMDGKFTLVSKYKTINCGQKIYSKTVDTTLDIISNGSKFILIRSQSDGNETIKRFSLETPSQWIRSDGKCLYSVFKQQNVGPNKSRLVETIEDGAKRTVYFYDFDIPTNHLTIEWTVGSIKKVEVFSRNA